MIVNLERFIHEEGPRWERLDEVLRRLADDPWRPLPVAEARELEGLYQRACADLARLRTYAADPGVRAYLEGLVARGYAEIHGQRASGVRVKPWAWLARGFPQTFRRQANAFWFALALMLAGSAFGALALAFDPDAKEVIMPFSHLQGSPSERVAEEEKHEREGNRHGEGRKASFAGSLMVHNTQVTLTAMALGLSAGTGTLVLMFYNGVILGAVAFDYVAAGQSVFLTGWLLPHGSVEIPAMLIGGQAGFVLAGALIGRRERKPLGARLRAAVPDVATLCGGAALLLVWAGIIESFLSQHHEPAVPYIAKIAFGAAQLAGLIWWLTRAGGMSETKADASHRKEGA
ncbi:MAG TPA: stage II sporulation protein M [Rariglobus sp.]|nr:stage II sporulation protein M [Rariglobus sp.]